MLTKYHIYDLDCANCAQKVEDMLNKRDDINECTINFASSLMFVESEDEIDIYELESAIQKMEPEVTLAKINDHSHTHSHEHYHEHYSHGHNHQHFTYEIYDLDCANCAQKVEDMLNKRDDIDECTINFASGMMFIGAKEEIDFHELEKAIQVMEPEVTLTKKEKYHHNHHSHGHNHQHFTYEIYDLDCANCAQKVEDMLNKRDDIDECTINFTSGMMFIGAKEEIDIHELEEVIQAVEPEVTITKKEIYNLDDERDLRILNGKGIIAYHIAGLDCANCAMKVEEAIKKMPQIKEAVLNFTTETLQVQPQESVIEEELFQALQQTIDSVEDGVTLSYKDNKRAIEKAKLFDIKKNWNMVIGVILYVASIIFSNYDVSIAGFLIAYLLIGYTVLLKAFKNIGRGEIFDENFLMVVATIGAFAIGEYVEAVAVMLFYGIGEIFQAYAVNKTRNSISSLMDIKSDFANLKTDDGVIQVESENVRIDDVIVVKVGEKVPLDGIVIKGSSMLDTSSLTGESVPRSVHENDEVLAGVVNLNEILEIKVTKPYNDSTVSRILELMENAASKKAPIEKFITKFAKIYTPTVVGLAVLLAIIPMFIFDNAVFIDWLYRALTFLVVSCPCALVISIPLGLYAGLGKASRLGALIKGGNYLELLKDVDTVVFDKTGTLTKGTFEVVEVNGDDHLLEYAAYGEYYSNHPIAQSIINKYHKDIDESQISHYQEIAGKGIDTYIRQDHVLLGNASLFESHGIEVIEPQSVGTIVFVAVNGEFKGSIVVADQIKETTIEGIRILKKSGIKNTVMLTGDHHKVALDISSRLGIDQVYSELLPQDKVSQLESIMESNNGAVAFVGDGINDAPVLARADVGIAMGGIGSDAAIEAADMVLMQDNIATIGDAIDISKRTNNILKQNVAFILVIKVGVLILTMFGLSNMWMGVFADVGVTLIAILNAMRILK
ncbi:MAG: cadmium-translocating P-type ATPase [Erysipelotrichaceae bacterium]|nr:cadmium-translocating P-type ATPase [Erysipelotrichaceae bacterium]